MILDPKKVRLLLMVALSFLVSTMVSIKYLIMLHYTQAKTVNLLVRHRTLAHMNMEIRFIGSRAIDIHIPVYPYPAMEQQTSLWNMVLLLTIHTKKIIPM